MRPLSIPAGTAVMLGRPAQPMAQALSESIAQVVRGIAGIREAYLPHCFVKDVVEPPAQVLVLVLDAGADRERVLSSVGDGLARVLPPGIHLDVWLLSEGDSLLDTVRGTRIVELSLTSCDWGCVVFHSEIPRRKSSLHKSIKQRR